MRKGELTLKVLEIIAKTAEGSANILGDIFYGMEKPTVSRAIHIYFKQGKSMAGIDVYFKNLRQVNNILYKLKRDGLIEGKAGVIPILTREGKYYLEDLMGKIYKNYLPPFDKYKKHKGKGSKIIIFDIPEKYRNKRNWIRCVLRDLDYEMIQKSAWRGLNNLPTELILDLKKFDLLEYVHIFSIKEDGTMLLD